MRKFRSWRHPIRSEESAATQEWKWHSSGVGQLSLGLSKKKAIRTTLQATNTSQRVFCCNKNVEIRTGFHRNEVRLLQLLASNRICAIVGDIFEDQSAFINMSRLGRHDRVLRRLS
jgi:hypothetical protein